MSGRTNTIHNLVTRVFNCLDASLCRVLLLLVWFALPRTDEECPEDVQYFVTDFDLGAVTDQFVRSSPLTNVVL